MSLVARPIDRASDRASDSVDALILSIFCHHCGGRGLRELDQGNGGNRRTWSGRCCTCGAESVFVVEIVAIHAGDREFAA